MRWSSFRRHLFQVSVALDQLANTLLGGWADETISSRINRNAERGYWYAKFMRCVLNLVLTPIKRNHCQQAYLSEITRAQLPPAFRRNPV